MGRSETEDYVLSQHCFLPHSKADPRSTLNHFVPLQHERLLESMLPTRPVPSIVLTPALSAKEDALPLLQLHSRGAATSLSVSSFDCNASALSPPDLACLLP